MLQRFYTIEEAALYAGKKRDEGYYAEIVHLHSGHMWGPLPILGFSVVVSELAAEEESVPLSAYDGGAKFSLVSMLKRVLNVVSFCIFWVFKLSLIAGVLLFIASVIVNSFKYPLEVLILLVGLVVLLLLFAIYIGGLTALFEVYKNDKANGHLVVKFFIATIALVLAILMPAAY